MGLAGGGFTEYEWFGENLSICRYARSKSLCLDYFVILVYQKQDNAIIMKRKFSTIIW